MKTNNFEVIIIAVTNKRIVYRNNILGQHNNYNTTQSHRFLINNYDTFHSQSCWLQCKKLGIKRSCCFKPPCQFTYTDFWEKLRVYSYKLATKFIQKLNLFHLHNTKQSGWHSLLLPSHYIFTALKVQESLIQSAIKKLLVGDIWVECHVSLTTQLSRFGPGRSEEGGKSPPPNFWTV